jgi:hypothetical protein
MCMVVGWLRKALALLMVPRISALLRDLLQL